jgi:hypothetical protein
MRQFPIPGRSAWPLAGVARPARARCVAAISLLVGLSGCVVLEQPLPMACPRPLAKGAALFDTHRLTDALARSLCPLESLVAEGPQADLDGEPAVVVPDPVDMQSYEADALGVQLGEHLRASIATVCRRPVRQVDMARDFHLTAGGLTALTREQSDLRKPSFTATTAYVSTYQVQDAQLTLISRRVDVDSGTMQVVAVKQASWGCTNPWFGKPEFVYRIK